MNKPLCAANKEIRMGFEDLLSNAGVSAIVAAIVSGLVTLRTSARTIQIENITQERAKWREKIRTNAQLVHKAATGGDDEKLSELKLVFELLLNPNDDEDQDILTSIERLKDAGDPQKRLPEFSKRIAYLLKHDWERAKHEAKPWFLSLKEPKRKSYA
jgi:hypothetical protein